MVIIHIYSPKWLMTTGVREKKGEGGWGEGRVVHLRTTVAHCKKLFFNHVEGLPWWASG